MTTNSTASLATPPTIKPPASAAARLFYSGAAAVLLLLMLLGFQQFYLHGRAFPGRPLTPPIRTLLILHGCAMTAWMLLFMLQPLLIFSRRHRVHMMLGRLGAALAAAVVVLGLCVAVGSARVNPPQLKLWGLSPRQFMIVPLVSILIFGVFVAIGVWYRRRPAIHRPMMLLSILAVVPAAVDRIDFIRNLYAGTIFGDIFGPFFGTLALGLVFLLVKWAVTRTWDRWYALGLAGLAIASALIVQVAPTNAWDHVAGLLLH